METTGIICEDFLVRETEKSFLVSNFIEKTETIRIEKSLIEKLGLEQEQIDVAIFLFLIEMERYNARSDRGREKNFIRQEEFSFRLKKILEEITWEDLWVTIEGMNFQEMKRFFFNVNDKERNEEEEY